MTLNMNEKKSLEISMAYRGFTECESAFFNSKKYQELLNTLNDLSENLCIPLDSPDYDAAQILKLGKEIIQKHTDEKKLLIPGINRELLKFPTGQLTSASEYNRIIDESIQYRSVTEIPVSFDLESLNEQGNTYTHVPFAATISDIEYFRNLPIISSMITLSGSPTNLRICSYVHEMCHALNYRNKGYTNNQLYDEVLSIFLELVTAIDLNNTSLRDVRLLQRMFDMKRMALTKELYENQNINPLTVIDYNKYIISTLLAFQLFSIYLTKQTVRKEMDSDLNSIFNGDNTLEDILEKYEVTEENGVETFKKVASYVKRY